MANRNTKRNRLVGEYATYKKKPGTAVNSSVLRQESGKARYKAPTVTDRNNTAIHPISGLTNREIQHMIP